MSILIKNVSIIDKNSTFHLQKVNVFYKDGKIKAIGKNIDVKAKEEIDGKGKFLSKAWIDTFAGIGSPGFEYRETYQSATLASTKSGFGNVLLVPNNIPITDHAAGLQNRIKESESCAVNFYPLGAVSKGIEGKDLAEMMDMKTAGAIAFTDGWHPIQNAQLLLKALEYVKGMDSLLIQVPLHKDLGKGALMNESAVSVALGLSGEPTVAEAIFIQRDIQLAKYANARLHISGVSTKEGIELIKKAKKDGLPITCSVTPYHLLFTEEQMQAYDSLYKVFPVLRGKEDVKAVKDALKDGWIDAIATHHKPHNWDEKVKELEYAAQGMACMETAWPMLLQAAPQRNAEDWVEILVNRPEQIFNIQQSTIESDAVVKLTLFDMDTEWQLTSQEKASLAYNVPLLNQNLKGKSHLLF